MTSVSIFDLSSVTADGIILDSSAATTPGVPGTAPTVAVSFVTNANGQVSPVTVGLTGIPGTAGKSTPTSTSTTIISSTVSYSSTPTSTTAAPPPTEAKSLPAGASIFLLIILPVLVGVILLTGLGLCIWRRRRKAKRTAISSWLDGLKSEDGTGARYRARLREMTGINIPSRTASRRTMEHPWGGLDTDNDQIPPLPELHGDYKSRSDAMPTEKRPAKSSEVNELERGELSAQSSSDKLRQG